MKLLSLIRRPATAPWPGNLRTLADDLREALDHNAELAAQLTAARQRADVADARAAADRLERQAAGQRESQVRAELAKLTADLAGLRIANAGLQKQLHDAMGYDDAAQYAIATGTGQPRKA
ncbi:hypothetical protein E6W39_24440 [Kitasatospora acidiphila]|uniref:Uncharacterized protein n=1 Tax=Kitasatospora acidiphila TaxID=2567942 RepID=A0A540W6Z0_9ACTN|nr:hypothetical protein [Kitasatospora acidiphila]TQF04798.1 hypothetical protein E6W39_24440 [Kitasatospora acidiphila]